jgi:hypothetical protein
VIDPHVHIPGPGACYEHYRGGRYAVITIARSSEDLEQLLVVYRSLERGHVWARPLGMWSAPVSWEQLGGAVGPRFMAAADYEQAKAQYDADVDESQHFDSSCLPALLGRPW